jgi:hypothetical protein
MPPQLKRLIPLFAVFIGLFLLARYFLVPETFGEYGHYRGASLGENAALELHFAGKEMCSMCHDDIASDLQGDQHRFLSCEVCHGPGMDHANSPEEHQLARPGERGHCGKCHFVHPAKNKEIILQVEPEEHYPENECITCHNPHKPWEVNIPDNLEENF